MSDYSEFFLSSPSSVVQLDLIEISHPDFSTTYRKVRNCVYGITVTLETDEVVNFEYYPMRIKGLGIRDTLDFGLRIDFGDLGEIVPVEIERVTQNNNFATKPIVKYRTYRSDNLTSPLFGPLTLEIDSFTFNREGATFTAKAPSLNISRTGELYKLDRFPALRGFL